MSQARRALLILVLALGVGAPGREASGQALLVLLFGDKLSSETLQLGLKVDAAFTGLAGIDGAGLRPAFAIGAILEIELPHQWSLQPELGMKAPGGAREFLGSPPGDPALDSVFDDVTVTRNLAYSNLSVLLKYRAGPVALGLGPQVAYLRKAEDVYEGTAGGADAFTLTRDVAGQHARWDFGLAGLLEYSLRSELAKRSLRIHLAPYLGLVDITEGDGADVRNFYVQVGVGIPVGGAPDTPGK